MAILALDISSVSTGCAIMNGEELIACGRVIMTGTIGFKLKHLYKSTRDLLSDTRVDKIIVEEIYRGPSTKTFKTLSMCRGVVELVAAEMGLPLEAVAVTTVRKVLRECHGLIGNKKEDVFEFVKNKYGDKFWTFRGSNDITDAIALGLASGGEVSKDVGEGL